jgi:hypothetical protein
MDRERIDPEPVSIIAAIIAAASLSVAAANYAKTHLKPAPSRVRAGIVDLLAKLEDEVRQLRADLAALREIFATAEYANDRAIRVRNGAYLTPANFLRYQAVSDDVYRRLRQLNKIGLKLEKQVGRSSTLTTQATTNLLGKAYEKLERLLDAKRLAEADAWSELDQLLELVQKAIAEVRQQLG